MNTKKKGVKHKFGKQFFSVLIIIFLIIILFFLVLYYLFVIPSQNSTKVDGDNIETPIGEGMFGVPEYVGSKEADIDN